MSGDPDNPSNESNRRTKRVNVSIPPEQHEEWTQFAREHQMSFSRLVRRGIAELRHQMQRDGVPREFQSLVRELEQHREKLDQMEDQLMSIDETITRLHSPDEQTVEQLADQILALFNQREEWTIPELTEELDLERAEVQAGITHLEAVHAVDRNDPDNPDAGIVRWERK